jgi:hypothetical protein
MTLSTEHVDSRESPTEPETVENDKQLPYMLAAEAKQSLEVNIETVDDALRQREEQIDEEIRNRFEMRLQSLLKGDPLLGLREQVHALRDCHPDLVKTTSDSDAASSITTNLTFTEDDEDGDSDDSSDDDLVQLSKQGRSRAFPWSPSSSYMRQVDEEAELIIPNAARLDRIMETLEKDTSPTSHARRTPRSVIRALARGSTPIMHDGHNLFTI